MYEFPPEDYQGLGIRGPVRYDNGRITDGNYAVVPTGIHAQLMELVPEDVLEAEERERELERRGDVRGWGNQARDLERPLSQGETDYLDAIERWKDEADLEQDPVGQYFDPYAEFPNAEVFHTGMYNVFDLGGEKDFYVVASTRTRAGTDQSGQNLPGIGTYIFRKQAQEDYHNPDIYPDLHIYQGENFADYMYGIHQASDQKRQSIKDFNTSAIEDGYDEQSMEQRKVLVRKISADADLGIFLRRDQHPKNIAASIEISDNYDQLKHHIQGEPGWEEIQDPEERKSRGPHIENKKNRINLIAECIPEDPKALIREYKEF